MIPFFAEESRVTEVVEVSEDYYVKENYGIIFVDASAGNVIIYIPALVPNRRYAVSKRDSSGNAVTLNFGNSLCNGESTQIITGQYDTILVVAAKTEWGIV